MLNVDSWFVGVRDGDEWAAQSAAPNALSLHSSAEGVFGAVTRVVTGSAVGSICLNQDAVGTKPSSVIPKRSTSDDVEECLAARARCFRTYAWSRVLSIVIRTSTIAQVPDSSGAQAGSTPAGRAERTVEAQRRALVCSACTQNNEVRHVVVKSSWGPDGGNPPSTRQGRRVRAAREGASGRSLMMQYRTERKRSAAEASRPAGELANGSEAHIRRAGGRIGDGVGTKFCVLTRGDLSAPVRWAEAIEDRKTRW